MRHGAEVRAKRHAPEIRATRASVASAMSDTRITSTRPQSLLPTAPTRELPPARTTTHTAAHPASASPPDAMTRVRTPAPAHEPLATQLVRALFDRTSLEDVVTAAVHSGTATRDEVPHAVFDARIAQARYGLALVTRGTHMPDDVPGLAFALSYGALTSDDITEAVRSGETARRAAYCDDTETMRHHVDWTPRASEREWLAQTRRGVGITALHALGHGELAQNAASHMVFNRELLRHRAIVRDIMEHHPISPEDSVTFLLSVHGIETADAQRIAEQAEANFARENGGWTQTPG